jgi:hypothetical protein
MASSLQHTLFQKPTAMVSLDAHTSKLRGTDETPLTLKDEQRGCREFEHDGLHGRSDPEEAAADHIGAVPIRL